MSCSIQRNPYLVIFIECTLIWPSIHVPSLVSYKSFHGMPTFYLSALNRRDTDTILAAFPDPNSPHHAARARSRQTPSRMANSSCLDAGTLTHHCHPSQTLAYNPFLGRIIFQPAMIHPAGCICTWFLSALMPSIRVAICVMGAFLTAELRYTCMNPCEFGEVTG